MEGKKLNPNIPADAVELVDLLTYDKLNLTRREGDAFFSAIQTLKTFVQVHTKEEKKPTSKKQAPKT